MIISPRLRPRNHQLRHLMPLGITSQIHIKIRHWHMNWLPRFVPKVHSPKSDVVKSTTPRPLSYIQKDILTLYVVEIVYGRTFRHYFNPKSCCTMVRWVPWSKTMPNAIDWMKRNSVVIALRIGLAMWREITTCCPYPSHKSFKISTDNI